MHSERGYNPEAEAGFKVSKWKSFVEKNQRLLAVAALFGFFQTAGCNSKEDKKPENTHKVSGDVITTSPDLEAPSEPEMLDELVIHLPSDEPKTLEDYRKAFNDPERRHAYLDEPGISDEELAQAVADAKKREKDMFRSGVLMEELSLAYSDISMQKDPEQLEKIFRKVYDTERAVLWGVQFGANPKYLDKKYKRVLQDEKYRKKLDGIMRHYAEKYQVPYEIIVAVASHESGFDDTAISYKGARSVMQVTPDTEKRFHDPKTTIGSLESNISAATNFLRYNFERYGSRYISLSGYCAGNGKVEKLLTERGLVPEDTKGDWAKVFKDKKVDIIRLLSSDYYKQHDNVLFQYPLMTLIEADMARGVMEGRYKKGQIPPLMSREEFKAVVEKYPEVGRRIVRGKGVKKATKFFKDLNITPAQEELVVNP